MNMRADADLLSEFTAVELLAELARRGHTPRPAGKMVQLTLPYPISANRYWASRVIAVAGRQMPVTYVTAEAKAFKSQVGHIARLAGVLQAFAGRVEIGVQLFPHRPLDFKTRMRKLGASWDDTVQCIDLDNANKVLLDSVKGLVIDDDKWVRKITAERMEPDDQGARVVLFVRQMPVPVVQADLLGATA